jgi:hypothetical protein
MSLDSTSRQHAIVMGDSLAGLLTARRVLSRHARHCPHFANEAALISVDRSIPMRTS